VLPLAVLLSTRSLPHVLLATTLSLLVVVRVLREGAGVWHNVDVLVLVVMLSWYLGAFSQHSVAGVQGLPRQVFSTAPALEFWNPLESSGTGNFAGLQLSL
jgi:membrane protein required for beta-lactamase induction